MFAPGSALMPKGVVRLKVPVGVRLSPSFTLSMPFLPTRASQLYSSFQ